MPSIELILLIVQVNCGPNPEFIRAHKLKEYKACRKAVMNCYAQEQGNAKNCFHKFNMKWRTN